MSKQTTENTAFHAMDAAEVLRILKSDRENGLRTADAEPDAVVVPARPVATPRSSGTSPVFVAVTTPNSVAPGYSGADGSVRLLSDRSAEPAVIVAG